MNRRHREEMSHGSCPTHKSDHIFCTRSFPCYNWFNAFSFIRAQPLHVCYRFHLFLTLTVGLLLLSSLPCTISLHISLCLTAYKHGLVLSFLKNRTESTPPWPTHPSAAPRALPRHGHFLLGVAYVSTWRALIFHLLLCQTHSGFCRPYVTWRTLS